MLPHAPAYASYGYGYGYPAYGYGTGYCGGYRYGYPPLYAAISMQELWVSGITGATTRRQRRCHGDRRLLSSERWLPFSISG